MLSPKRTLLCSAVSIALSSIAAPVLAQSCATYPAPGPSKLEQTGPGVMKVSFTASAPLRADSSSVRDFAWRKAKTKAMAELSQFIQVTVVKDCGSDETAGDSFTFAEGQELFSQEETYEEICNYATRTKVEGVSGIMEVGRCATPVSEGGEVRVTVGVSTGTQAAAGLVRNGSTPTSNPIVEQNEPTNRNSFTPTPTGYSVYSDDW
mgnify:CR=1 FL=1